MLIINFLLIIYKVNYAQTGSIHGKITDASTGEDLIGTTIIIQGTTTGTITDLSGNFILNNIPEGVYNLVISYVSYDRQTMRVTVPSGGIANVEVNLQPTILNLEGVQVVGYRRSNTEMSMISSIRASDMIASGISSQQISRSQDKDASEVLRRVPSVSIRDGRFIIVRGLTERYNTVWLNNASTPSSEADKRAFSFDAIPSGLIDYILIYKTPAPEIPADFAGAMINIQTKNLVDRNKISISYSDGFRNGTTFNSFYKYKGGKTDWLGFDNGTRALPSDFPSTAEFRQLANNPTEEQKDKITSLGREFSNIWTPKTMQAHPDQSVGISLQKRFTVGKISIGNISAITYSNSLLNEEIFRAGYEAYDTIHDKPRYDYKFNDQRYVNSVRVGGLMNWLFIFGNNQKIEFRNLFNQLGSTRTTLRDGQNFYGGSYERSYELAYESRSTYSGQLGGDFSFNKYGSQINWTLGYAYANKLQPDIRRIKTSRNDDTPETSPYVIGVNFNADPTLLGRLFLKNYEHIYTANANLNQKIRIGSSLPEIKTGFYYEYKTREFIARNIGYAIANILQYDQSANRLPVDTIQLFSPEVFAAIDQFFQPEYINSTTGIKIDESTNKSDSYDAKNRLFAIYAGIKLPVAKIINLYPGLRLEDNLRILHGFNEIGDSVNISKNVVDLFPSCNATVNLSDQVLVRLAYGKSINRPEFREISPYSFYDFEEKATIYGNDTLKDAYVQNYDLRLEWYPTPGELLTIGGFYKDFSNPIEAHLKDFGTGFNYKYFNALSAKSYGIEVDVRKRLYKLSGMDNMLHYLRNLTLVVNASLIKSEIKNNDPTERDKVRKLQGQSPYLINFGIFYQQDSLGISACILYNRIGERISYVGDVNNPHIYEMPFNSLDFTFDVRLMKNLVLLGGIKNILDDKVVYRQYEEFFKYDEANMSYQKVKRPVIYRSYKPGRLFNLGLIWSF
jgi:outer membrane receptor for ferrienterochelin and colicin